MVRLLLPSALFLSLAACGGQDSDSKTMTKLDAVEVQPGTISDSMIILDDSNVDGTAVDDRVPADTAAKGAEKTDDDSAADSDAAAADDDSADPDAVPIPTASKALAPKPAPAKAD